MNITLQIITMEHNIITGIPVELIIDDTVA